MKQTPSYLTGFLIGAGVGSSAIALADILGLAIPGYELLILHPLTTAALWAGSVVVGGLVVLKIRHQRTCKKVQSCSSVCSKGSTGCCG